MHIIVPVQPGIRRSLRSLRAVAAQFAMRVFDVTGDVVAAARVRATTLAQTISGHPQFAVVTTAMRTSASAPVQLAEAPTDERPTSARRFAFRLTHERAVTLLATALSIGAYAWYAAHGYTLAYADAVSHMMIARRVLFSPTPGLGQFGTVWPPFSHILMLPFIWIDPLYRSGLAGAIPSMACYIIAALYLFRSAKLLFSSAAAGWVAALIFALNPNILYLQSTPMTELVLLGTILMGLFYLFRWVEAERASDLVICAAAFAAGTLVRYDAWALAAAELLVVAFIAWRRHGAQVAEAMAWLYGMLAFAGCAGWALYNWALFGDPLYFLNGPYSAGYQQDIIKAHGDLPTYHNIVISVHEYVQAAADMTAWPLLALAVVGCVVALLRFRLSSHMLPVYAMWILLIFNILCLFLGITAIYTPEFHPLHTMTYFNIRYGVMVIPEIALFAAALASWRREWVIIGLLLAALFSGFNPNLGSPYSLRDPLSSTASKQNMREAQWLDQHYHGGTVLIGGAPFSVLVFDTGLPDQDFMNENTPGPFDQAVAAPQKYATWIVMGNGDGAVYDAVHERLANRTDWRKYYVLRATINGVQFYERIGSK